MVRGGSSAYHVSMSIREREDIRHSNPPPQTPPPRPHAHPSWDEETVQSPGGQLLLRSPSSSCLQPCTSVLRGFTQLGMWRPRAITDRPGGGEIPLVSQAVGTAPSRLPTQGGGGFPPPAPPPAPQPSSWPSTGRSASPTSSGPGCRHQAGSARRHGAPGCVSGSGHEGRQPPLVRSEKAGSTAMEEPAAFSTARCHLQQGDAGAPWALNNSNRLKPVAPDPPTNGHAPGR